MCHLALGEPVKLPVKVYIQYDLKPLFTEAIGQWNQYRNFFEVVDIGNTALIISGSKTWVNMYEDILFWDRGTEVHWAVHELGHLLHLADHIFTGWPIDGYINPGYSDDSYRGVMDYGTYHTKWFGPDDMEMFNKLWPLENKIQIPMV